MKQYINIIFKRLDFTLHFLLSMLTIGYILFVPQKYIQYACIYFGLTAIYFCYNVYNKYL